MSPSYNAATLPAGIHSTHALGTRHPDPKESIKIDGDVEVPMGKAINYSPNGMGANEFIVYNTNQIKMRYMIKWKMWNNMQVYLYIKLKLSFF